MNADDQSEEERSYVVKSNKFWGNIVLKCTGIFMKRFSLTKDSRTLQIYKKYLGEDYKFETFFSTVIGNHIAWADILNLMTLESPSFVAKASADKAPILSGINRATGGILIDRSSEDAREATKNFIVNRQTNVETGKCRIPVCLYPEGTATNGKCLIEFKKGAFFHLSPIKPYIQKQIQNSNNASEFWEISTGGMNILLHLIMTFTFIYNKMESYELPVIKPNEFMFKKYEALGKDKVEIYTNVVREIMSEVSGLNKINSGYEDKLNFLSEVKGKTIKNT